MKRPTSAIKAVNIQDSKSFYQHLVHGLGQCFTSKHPMPNVKTNELGSVTGFQSDAFNLESFSTVHFHHCKISIWVKTLCKFLL